MVHPVGWNGRSLISLLGRNPDQISGRSGIRSTARSEPAPNQLIQQRIKVAASLPMQAMAP